MSLTEDSKFTLTLNRLIAIAVFIIGLSFTVGMSYQSLLPDRQLQEKQTQEIQDIKVTLAKVTTILENMEEKQTQARQDLSDVQSKTHMMNAEIQLISSYVKEDTPKNKRK